MNLRFQELLPFYVNGTLQGDERDWMERQLAEHADARAELDAVRALQSRIMLSLPEVPDTIGLDKVMTRIRADRPGWFDRLAAWLGLSGGLRPATAFAGCGPLARRRGSHSSGSGEFDPTRTTFPKRRPLSTCVSASAATCSTTAPRVDT